MGGRSHKLRPPIGADAPPPTALGAASGSSPRLGPVSLQQVLEVITEFDDSGGASLGLVAWELCVEEELVAPAWQQAIRHELISPAGRDSQEQLWRLTSAGWAAVGEGRAVQGAHAHACEPSPSPCVDPIAPTSTGATYHWACSAGDPPNAST
jgi:hypothetical protein